jgi:hypothetical protein
MGWLEWRSRREGWSGRSWWISFQDVHLIYLNVRSNMKSKKITPG